MKNHMKRRTKKHRGNGKYFLTVGMITPILLCSITYIALALYYQESFSFGTWVNGVYCTGKSVNEINEELLSADGGKTLTILGRNDETETLDLNSIQYQEDYLTPLENMKENQNPYLWGRNLLKSKSQVLIPVISYNTELLEKCLSEYAFMKQDTINTIPQVKIVESPEGYALFDNTRQIIDRDKVYQKVSTAIINYEHQIDLEEEACYEDVPITREMQDIYTLWDKVKTFQDFHVRYLFGDTIENLDSATVADWITKDENDQFVLDEDGSLILDQEMVKEYIAGLAAEYDTIGGKRQFQTTRGDVVIIEGGTYGNQLNQKAEVEYLIDAFTQHNEADRTPEYTVTARKQGTDDIGTTYIEIDMTNQTMYYYENGTLKLETPVVTGNTSRGRGTPERVCYVYAKQKNRILRGPGYASHVNFWMPVNGGIGIHDASWRKQFGGSIYEKNGSHGCINTPYDVMKQLYDMAEIGTPVIMFY
ncbi:MAG: L,D-transpeptidase family protein [Lachnospiraceae bacterium]|nr:L,D-transpeptidase family protein [Lachnospiraceae bacterium]